MNHFSYQQVPSPKQFQQDSSITFAIRRNDEVLIHIDWLLARYEGRNSPETESLSRVILADLFMTCNFWIKSYHAGNVRMEKARYPAVLAVFEVVVNTLSRVLSCNRGAVPVMLAEIYGHDMHYHGLEVDHREQRARYLSKLESRVYRLRFRGGLAYQYQWWKRNRFSPTLVLAESKRAYTAISRRGNGAERASVSENFGGFAMTLEREIFMWKPDVGTEGGQDGLFHSSFTGGDVVIMAGTMLIKGGAILGIRGDSGHYKPDTMNMALLLQGLAMYGVSLTRITVYSWEGVALDSASEFIKSRMSWTEFEKTRMAERGRRADADKARVETFKVDPRFPNLPPRGPARPPRPGQMPPSGQPLGVAPSGTADNYN